MLELIIVFLSIVVIHYKFGGGRSMAELLNSLQNCYTNWEGNWKAGPGPSIDSGRGKQTTTRPAAPLRQISAPMLGHEQRAGENFDVPDGQLRSAGRGEEGGTSVYPKRKISLPVMRTSASRTSLIQGKEHRDGGLAQFKSMPSLLPEVGNSRSFLRNGCTKCSPLARRSLVEEVQSLGLHNLLLVKTLNRGNGYLKRKFHHLAHIYETRSNFCYPDVAKDVLTSASVKAAIENAAMQDISESDIDGSHFEDLKAKHRNRALSILENMRAKISILLVRITAYVLFKVLGRLLTFIQVKRPQLEMVKKIDQSTVPVIYLPLHRSHLDYILVTFILYNYEIKAPLVAAGDNLRIPFFGFLLRGLGAFFIKRKLDPQSGKRDFVYRAILQTYMEESLKAGHSMEFFLEGGRSRSGKACLPKAGLLSVVVDTFLKADIEDAYIVPVGLNYEKLLDGSFISEQMGQAKVKETFISTIRAIWRVFNSNYGTVRVDFSRPFSLREFIQAANAYVQSKPRDFLDNSSSQDIVRRLPSSASLYGTDIVIEDQRQLIKGLAEHVLHDAVHSTTIMSTNLVAFLLLNKYRKGVLLRSLIQDFNWLWDETLERGREVGFSGSTKDVIYRAIQLLGPKLVAVETPEPIKSNIVSDLLFVKPNLALPNVLELSYYSNVTISVFLGDAVVANALFILLGNVESLQDCETELTISRRQLLEKALDLCDILQYEFIFTPPCVSLDTCINEVIQEFLLTEILIKDAEPEVEKAKWATSVAQNLAFSDSEPDEDDYPYDDLRLKVNLKGDGIRRLKFYQNIIAPFLEGYWLLGRCLLDLVENEIDESEFIRFVQKSHFERIDVEYPECISADILKNAIKLFESWKVLESHLQDKIKVIFLSDEFDNVEKVSEVLNILMEFRK